MLRLLLVLTLAAGPAAADGLTADHARRLEHLVVQDCGSCHGLTRKGGLGSPLTAEALAHFEPEGIAMVILDGVPGTAMPPWRPLLSDEEALWIAEYLLKDDDK
ncbi:c-type cytochrome [Polymorphum gilvum]|uniref:Cytochrome c, nitrite reductase associated (NirC) n=1 Tax=Polymorphum gilvum (strain LMG 25793 / CGMCC 1.9160 / SL003B-26A1) TaxID=991905 RepID=F2J4R5_POLGS|nr:cytochrome c [Polymorphum gilvum]ADZ69007.1 Cytochrome c, nitrite reductase associated (NirC) [Polymorphum gilvum SL003B-26A1]